MGTFLLTYLRDRTMDTPEDDYLDDRFLRTDQNRYWLRGKADHYFSDSLVARLDVDVVSDRDFMQEFRGGLFGYDATNRQFLDTFNRGVQEETIFQRTSTLQGVKSWDSMLFMGELQSVKDVRDIPLTATAVHTLPRVQFNGRSFLSDTPLSVAWDSELINYWREKGVGYQRFDVHPRLVLAIPRGPLEGHLTGGIRQTSYLVETHGDAVWGHERSQHRTVEDFEAEIATTFFRDFGMEVGEGKTFTHTVRPTLIYNYIPSVDQTTLQDLEIDDVDQIAPQNWLTYRLNNHFDLGEGLATGALVKRYLGYFRVSQTYDIREDRRLLTSGEDRQRQFSDVLVDLDVYPLPNLRLNYETAISVYGQGATYYKIFSSYADAFGNAAFVDFNYQRDPSATRPFFYSEEATESEQKLTLGLLAHVSQALSVQGDLTQVWRTEAARDVDHLEESVRVLYRPSCWALELSASKTPDDKRIALVFSLTGIGELLGLGLRETGLQYEVL
jgi:LPS-assembly protein